MALIRWRRGAAALAAFVLALPLLASASAKDIDAVRRAVERGEIHSLARILEIVRKKLPGEIVGIEVERKKGHWVYEFVTVDSNGRISEVYVDARTGDIERIKEK